MSTLIQLFVDRANRHPARTFISTGDGSEIAYGEAAARVAGLVERLRSQGLERGDRVVAHLDDPESLVWFVLACAAIGAVPLPLGSAYAEVNVQRIARRCSAKLALTAIPPAPPSDPSLLLGLAEQSRAQDPVIILATSGSTGEPKLVRCSNGSFPWAAATMLAPWTVEEEHARILLTQTMTHGGGLFSLVLALVLGGRLMIPSELDTSVAIEEAERFAPTLLLVVPRVLQALAQKHAERYGTIADRAPFCGGRVRRIFIGGAVSDESLLSRFESRGIEMVEVFGGTECCMVSISRPGRRRPGYVGELFPGVEVRTAPDGELLVRSPHLTSGFEGDDALSREVLDADGFYRTGDLGRLEDGYLRFLGRKRDVLHSSEGSYVYPEVIEQRLESIAPIEEAILLGDAKPFVIALLAVRSASSGSPFDELELERFAELHQRVQRAVDTTNAELDAFARIRRFAVFPAPFPAEIYRRLRMGKVSRDRARALEMFADRIARMYSS